MSELSKALGVIALARFHRAKDELRKSTAPGSRLIVPKRPKTARSKRATPGEFVRVMRPDMHQAPVLTRMVSGGKHGVTVLNDQGQHIRVRHEHIVETHPRPTARERAAFVSAAAATGVPMPLEERFLRLDPQGQPGRRPTASQLELLQHLTSHGVPLDMPRIGEDASYDDVEAILSRYIDDPEGQIGRVKGRGTVSS